jgi:hypothetical protein
MVTELVDEYETCSEPDENIPQQKSAPSKPPTASTTATKRTKVEKPSTSSGKRQGSLLTFFGPKTT